MEDMELRQWCIDRILNMFQVTGVGNTKKVEDATRDAAILYKYIKSGE